MRTSSLHNSRLLLGISLCCLTTLSAGCGSGQPTGDRVPVVPAAGVLTYKGEPLAHYQITLTPTDTTRPAAGITNEKGEFTLGTNKPDDGAVTGPHKVSVTYIGPPGAGGDGMNNFAPAPPPKIKLPAKYNRPDTSEATATIPASGDRNLKIDLQ